MRLLIPLAQNTGDVDSPGMDVTINPEAAIEMIEMINIVSHILRDKGIKSELVIDYDPVLLIFRSYYGWIKDKPVCTTDIFETLESGNILYPDSNIKIDNVPISESKAVLSATGVSFLVKEYHSDVPVTSISINLDILKRIAEGSPG